MWRNRPTVVIGRTQNPWVECDLRHLQAHGVALARRRSGGGTVYHDLGNMNFTFFGPRKDHNPKRNAQLLSQAIAAATGVTVRAAEV